MELEIFAASGGEFLSQALIRSHDGFEFRTIQNFEFSSENQCQTVLSKREIDGRYFLFMKGAPEKILQISLTNNTLRTSLRDQIEALSSKGYRVIALASKELGSVDEGEIFERKELEKNLFCVGLVAFQNPMRAGSREVIESLNEAKITSVMVTGDNFLTAFQIASECAITEPGQNFCRLLIGSDSSLGFQPLNF